MSWIIMLVIGQCFLMGIVGLIKPQQVFDNYDLDLSTADARNEVRAIYGGQGFVFGGLLIAAHYFPDLKDGIYLTLSLTYLGVAAGRLISFAIERTGLWPVVFLVLEIVVGGVLFLNQDAIILFG